MPGSNEPVSLPPARILLVEDGVTNSKLISLILRRAGALVTTADNGQKAIGAVASEDFDLILMDMQMPVMDGYAATRILRERGYTKPILALTAHAMKGDEQKCRAAGCSGFLTKPIDSDLLLRTLSAVLRNAASSAKRSGMSARPMPQSALVSTLPAEDPDFCEIVQEFVESLPAKISALRAAWTAGKLDEVARLAHWLKGAGGSVGFAAFTAPAADLERLARARQTDGVERVLEKILGLAARVHASNREPITCN